MQKSIRTLFVLACTVVLTTALVGWAAAQQGAAPGFLGVRLADGENGVMVTEVLPDTGAEAAGVLVDDVLVSVNETAVTTAEEVVNIVREAAVGDVLTLEFTRAGELVTLEVTLGERPTDLFEMQLPEGMTPPDGMTPGNGRGGDGNMPDGFRFEQMPPMMMQQFGYGNGRLGVTFVTLDEQVAAEREATVTEGALIVEVVADSPAALAGLAVDDVVTAVNGELVDAERTLRDRLIAYEPGDVVTLDVLRAGETLALEVTLGEQVMGSEFNMPGMQGRMGPNGQFRFEIPMPEMTPEMTPEATAEPNT